MQKTVKIVEDAMPGETIEKFVDRLVRLFKDNDGIKPSRDHIEVQGYHSDISFTLSRTPDKYAKGV